MSPTSVALVRSSSSLQQAEERTEETLLTQSPIVPRRSALSDPTPRSAANCLQYLSTPGCERGSTAVAASPRVPSTSPRLLEYSRRSRYGLECKSRRFTPASTAGISLPETMEPSHAILPSSGEGSARSPKRPNMSQRYSALASASFLGEFGRDALEARIRSL